MICKDLLPIAIVEYEGFKKLLKLLAPLYKVPSKKTMMRKLEVRYDILKRAFVKKIEALPYYCLTADNWTDCSNQSYVGITIHYVNESSEMISKILGCFPLYENHTSAYLKESMTKIFDDFKINLQKITAMVTDGAPNIKKACIDLVGKDKHLVCIAHVVAHLLPDVLSDFKELTTILDKVKAVVKQIKRSIPASDALKERQIKDGKSEGTVLKLKLDVPTRWSTKIDMIESYIILEPYLYHCIIKCENPVDLLTRHEWKVLNDVLPLMNPIKSVITEISGDSYPTASLIIAIIHCMEMKIDSIIPATGVGATFKNKLKISIGNRFKNIEHCSTLAMSTILDARYKKIHFKDPYAVSSSLSRIRKELDKTILVRTIKTPDVKERRDSQSESSIWDMHDSIIAQSTEQLKSSIDKSVELDQYLKLPIIHRTKNLFAYWQSVKASFPVLSNFALRQVSILATSVSSERLFSKAGNTKRDRRNRLTDSSNHRRISASCTRLSNKKVLI